MRVLWVAFALWASGAPGAGVQAITIGSHRERVVALTFDAGADRGYAARILSTLERNHIHATFGMTGKWAEANPALVRRMARDGDTFINHTYDHRSFTGYSSGTAPLTTAQRWWEIAHADAIIRKISGREAKPYFRPPFGDYDAATLSVLQRMGYRYMVMWTVDTLGWDHLPASQILMRSLRLLQPGAIYLMHVGIQSQDALALPALIRELRARGYRFETIPQLVARR